MKPEEDVAQQQTKSVSLALWTSFTSRSRIIVACVVLPAIASLSCSNPQPSLRSVKFAAAVRHSAARSQVYLSGSGPQLGNWNPSGVPMSRESDSLWSVTLSFPKGERIEYKVTAGSWWTQAIDSSERVYDNISLTVEKDTTVTVQVYDWLNWMSNGRPVLTATRFRPNRQSFSLDGLWRYHPGDDAAWSSPAFDDSGWAVTDPFIRWTRPSDPQWNGKGWFRFHVYADSSLWNATLAIRIEQLGASQIFYNGRLLYSFGQIGSATAPYKPNAMTWWQEFRVDPQYDQLIAVRYANNDWRRLQGMAYTPGFLISLKDLNSAFRSAVDVRRNAERQMVFTLIPLILALIHLSLYGFLRNQRQNLYYAFCMLGFAGLTFFSYERDLTVDVGQIILFTKLGGFSVAVAILSGAFTGYELRYNGLPKRAFILVGMFLLATSFIVLDFSPGHVTTTNYIFFGLTTLESVYSVFGGKARRFHGGWIILAGFLALSTFILMQLLIDYNVITPTAATSQVYVYGMLSLAISMSVFLSYNFARVNKDLEFQLDNVRRFSEKAIEQERISHTLALERKAIELESDRKSKELESARALQLSLLPQKVPQIEGLDIAAMMRTATEVGGDYYDFFISGKNALTIVVGDATGHGLKAGNLVTATKGLLNILARTEKVEEILIEANRAIKGMNLRMLTMCLAVARVEGTTLRYSSAGMPPLLVSRARTKQCEKLVLKAMPLGAVDHFPYTSLFVTLRPGDAVAMVSDGLLEIFNAAQETFGIENVMKSLEHFAGESADRIVQGLYEDGKAWGGGAPLADDLTIVVFKLAGTQPSPLKRHGTRNRKV
ncbi:MAG TPA: SpoIIE family protein phosphatase [Bacteroidota bacterium]|nr:SpoIIE family protein phosphatase [Bacteroidota bacterium]